MDRSVIDDYEEMIVNFGAFSYSNEKMAAILLINEKQIANEMEDKNSDFYRLYSKGKNMRDYVLDLKLFEMAQSGDLKALDEFYARVD